MKLKEIIEQEQNGCLQLYKEGSFWRAYEQSAYYFVQYIKPYKALKRYFKVVSREVVYLGFPLKNMEAHLAALPQGVSIEAQTEDCVRLRGFEDAGDFQAWKTQQPLLSDTADRRQETGDKVASLFSADCFRRLQTFDLEHANLNQCLLLLQEIKQTIKIGMRYEV